MTFAEGRLDAAWTTSSGRRVELHLDLAPVLTAVALRRARKLDRK